MVTTAIIGAGHWGPNLIGALHANPRSTIQWVVDLDEARLQAARERFPDIKTSRDVTDALGDDSVDAVVIATPTGTHFELCGAAIRAGKHVLVEKPIADSVEKAVTLVNLTKGSSRVLMVGHTFIYNRAIRWIKGCLSNGDLGAVYYMSAVRTNLGPIRIDVNVAWDLAAHDISIANYWLDAEPVAVSAIGSSWINRGVEDAVFTTLRYPRDVLVNVHSSWLSPHKTREVTIIGDKRMLAFDDTNLAEPVRVYDKQVLAERSSVPFTDSFASFRMSVSDGDITIPKITTGEPVREECDHFIDCVERGERPLSGPIEGLAVVRTLDAVSRSLRQGGREVMLQPCPAAA